MASTTNRAAWLQSFQTGESSTARAERIAKMYGGKTVEEYYADVEDTITVEPEVKRTSNNSTSRRQGVKVSDKQVAFIKSLINQKDTSTLVILHGQTLDADKMADMEIGRGKALIEKLLSMPNKPSLSTKITDQGSDKQRAFLQSLMNQLNLTESDINGWGYKAIGDAITHLIAMTKVVKPIVKAESTNKEEITEGAYWYTDQHGDKLIARVQRARTGAKRLYAKLQTEVGGKEFEYAQGLIYKLKAENKLSLDDMKAFAQQYRACADCGTGMTNPISIARGVGPICSGKGYTL